MPSERHVARGVGIVPAYLQGDEERSRHAKHLEDTQHAGLGVPTASKGLRSLQPPSRPEEMYFDPNADNSAKAGPGWLGERGYNPYTPADHLHGLLIKEDTPFWDVDARGVPLNADGKPASRPLRPEEMVKPATSETSRALCALALGAGPPSGRVPDKENTWEVGRRRQIAPKSYWVGIG